MSGWDRGSVYHADVTLTEPRLDSDSELFKKCQIFFEEFRIDNNFIYRYLFIV